RVARRSPSRGTSRRSSRSGWFARRARRPWRRWPRRWRASKSWSHRRRVERRGPAVTDEKIHLRDTAGGAASTCATILATLPDWFGIPAANDDYVRMADVQPGVIAAIDGDDVGITTIVHHSPYAAEVHLMAVV